MFSIWCSHETAAEDAAVPPSSTRGRRRSVLFVGSVLRSTRWPLSESVSNLCLCFRPRTVSQQVQSVSVRVSSDQVTAQSSRCKFSVR